MFDSLKNRFQLRFKNREFAAKILAGALEDTLKKIKIDKKDDSLLILGIPRGGIVVADIVASKLPYNCDFDVIFPKKLTAPHNQEIAIGAIIAEEKVKETIFLNDELIRDLDIDNDYIEKEIQKQLEEIRRRKSLYYVQNEMLHRIDNKIIVLIDDGAATGATIIVAARWIRIHNPKKLIIAIPVTSKGTSNILKAECDMVVTGTTPSSAVFKTVGQYYQDFRPIEDHEVIEVCRKRILFKL